MRGYSNQRSIANDEQPMNRYEEYFDLKQTSDIQSYIAQKSEAALLSSDLTPTTILYGFIKGLKQEYKNLW